MPSRCTPTLSSATFPAVNVTANRFPTHRVRNSPSAARVSSGFHARWRETDTVVPVAELPPLLLVGLACEPEQPASNDAANTTEISLIHDKVRPGGTIASR
jgi:hypothetical protein